jgi:hypothetical protein
VTSVLKINAEVEEGRRCLSYDYTWRVIVTITVHRKIIDDKIRRVKMLPGYHEAGGWVEDGQMVGELWDDGILKATSVEAYWQDMVFTPYESLCRICQDIILEWNII